MEFINLKIDNHIGVVTLNRPPANAFNTQMYKETINVFNKINNTEEIKVVILKSTGSFFSAGNDVNEFLELDTSSIEAGIKQVTDAMDSITNCRVPVICIVNGPAYGSGCIAAASCDVIVASEDASFSIPEIKMCLVGGARDLARLLPFPLVRYMVLTGDSISAKEMKQHGGIYKIVSQNELYNTAIQVAEKITNNSPMAVELTKKTLNNYDIMNIPETVDVEYSKKLVNHPDHQEAARAFLEKRKPIYKN